MKHRISSKQIALIVLVLLCATIAVSGTKTGMVELLNPTGARQAGRGETASLNDMAPYNLEYNPASIVGITQGQIGLSHNSYIQGRNGNSFAAIFPIKNLACGAFMRLSSIDDIEARGETPTTDPDYLFSTYDFALKFSAAMSLSERLKAGLTLGWMMEKIDVHRANTAGIGLGLIYNYDYGLTFHGSVSNFGPDFKFISEDQKAPTIYRTGMEYNKDLLSVAVDYVNSKDGDSHLHFGGEYLLEQALFLRAGYMTGYDSRDFTAGVGFLYRYIRIDYAFVPYQSDLGDSHRFTLIYSIK